MHLSCAFKDMLYVVAFTVGAPVTIQWQLFLLHSRVKKYKESLRDSSETVAAAADRDHSISYFLQKETIIRLILTTAIKCL